MNWNWLDILRAERARKDVAIRSASLMDLDGCNWQADLN
jgi:hypothetical protein